MSKQFLQFILSVGIMASAWMEAGSASEGPVTQPVEQPAVTEVQAIQSEPSNPTNVVVPAQIAASTAPVPVVNVDITAKPTATETAETEPNGTVRVVGIITDIGKKYSFLVPNIPVWPFKEKRQWFRDREISVHCALEWKDDKGKWWFAEMRSSKWDKGSTEHRVGLGQFPGTAYIAYGIFINPGRVPREIDLLNRPIVVSCDFPVKCDYKKLDAEIRKYGAFNKKPGDPGTGGYGKENVGLGGPAYKPAQNSNTLVSYCLKKCGVDILGPEMTTGWGREPVFPYSSDTRYPKYNGGP